MSYIVFIGLFSCHFIPHLYIGVRNKMMPNDIVSCAIEAIKKTAMNNDDNMMYLYVLPKSAVISFVFLSSMASLVYVLQPNFVKNQSVLIPSSAVLLFFIIIDLLSMYIFYKAFYSPIGIATKKIYYYKSLCNKELQCCSKSEIKETLIIGWRFYTTAIVVLCNNLTLYMPRVDIMKIKKSLMEE